MQFSAILMSLVSLLMELTMRLMLIDLASNWNAFSHDHYHDYKTFTWSKMVDGQFSHLLFHVVRIKIHCTICYLLKGSIKIYFLLNCPASDCLVFAVPANYVTRVQIIERSDCLLENFNLVSTQQMRKPHWGSWWFWWWSCRWWWQYYNNNLARNSEKKWSA